MDATAIESLLSAGPYGLVALLMVVVVWQNKKIDEIRLQQINDVKLALDVVSKSTDRMASAEERMGLQTEANKELVAVAKTLLNRGKIQ